MVVIGAVDLTRDPSGVAVGSVPLSVLALPSPLAILKAVALAIRLQDLAAEGEPVHCLLP
jgi:hypothetical protein